MRLFLVNIANFLRTFILKEICERLILKSIDSKWKKHRKNSYVFRDDNWRRIQNPLEHLRWSF